MTFFSIFSHLGITKNGDQRVQTSKSIEKHHKKHHESGEYELYASDLGKLFFFVNRSLLSNVHRCSQIFGSVSLQLDMIPDV